MLHKMKRLFEALCEKTSERKKEQNFLAGEILRPLGCWVARTKLSQDEMATRLILIRHGETDYSLEKRYCGLTDAPLNKKGMEQAGELCLTLQGEDVDRIYSSDLKRALEFARIVFRSKEIEVIPEFREMNFGVFEGLTHEGIMERHAEIYKKWLRDPLEIAIPEGDSLVGFKERIEKALKKIVRGNRNKTLAIVTHAGPIKIIMGNIMKSKNIWDINPELGSFWRCVYE